MVHNICCKMSSGTQHEMINQVNLRCYSNMGVIPMRSSACRNSATDIVSAHSHPS